MSPFTRTKRTRYSQRTPKKTNVHSPAKVTVLKSFIVTVALSNASFGGGTRRENQCTINWGKKAILGLKCYICHLSVKAGLWALCSIWCFWNPASNSDECRLWARPPGDKRWAEKSSSEFWDGGGGSFFGWMLVMNSEQWRILCKHKEF